MVPQGSDVDHAEASHCVLPETIDDSGSGNSKSTAASKAVWHTTHSEELWSIGAARVWSTGATNVWSIGATNEESSGSGNNMSTAASKAVWQMDHFVETLRSMGSIGATNDNSSAVRKLS